MKKFLCTILSLCLALALFSACVSDKSETPESGKVTVVSTVFAPYDFARQVGGDNVEVTMLLPPGSESHSYEPTPQDILKIQNCDIFIYIGGETDAWVGEVLESMDTSGMRIITLLGCVNAVEEQLLPGMQDDEHADLDTDADQSHDEEPNEAEYDEHVWTSPKNAKLIVQKLADTFCEIDAENEQLYKTSAANYITELDALDAKFTAAVDGGARKTLVFGDRFPFRYFADAYGLQCYAAFPGCSTETEASAATVAFLIDKINAEHIPVVFHVELSNKKMAQTLSEATGAKVLLFHACHNITKDEMQSGVTYIELMNKNLEALKEALA